MLGNDIVDLALAKRESNWKRKGFLDKIFTKSEQLLIHEAGNPDVMVWNLWSRKEAAYKIYNRQTGIRGYIPTQLECFYENETLGMVFCNRNIYYTQTQISKDVIRTIAVTAKDNFNKILKVNPETKISKINGYPFIFDEQNKIRIPVSISHHGRFYECISFT